MLRSFPCLAASQDKQTSGQQLRGAGNQGVSGLVATSDLCRARLQFRFAISPSHLRRWPGPAARSHGHGEQAWMAARTDVAEVGEFCSKPAPAPSLAAFGELEEENAGCRQRGSCSLRAGAAGGGQGLLEAPSRANRGAQRPRGRVAVPAERHKKLPLCPPSSINTTTTTLLGWAWNKGNESHRSGKPGRIRTRHELVHGCHSAPSFLSSLSPPRLPPSRGRASHCLPVSQRRNLHVS